MKIFTEIITLILLNYSMASSGYFECAEIDKKQRTIPLNATQPMALLPNFDCKLKIPISSKDYWICFEIFYEFSNDFDNIKIDDGIGHHWNIKKDGLNSRQVRLIAFEEAFLRIQTSNETSSKLLINLEYIPFSESKQEHIQLRNDRPNYVQLSLIDNRTIYRIHSNQQIHTSISIFNDNSTIGEEDLSSYYLFDGDYDNYSELIRLDDLFQNYLSINTSLTIINLSPSPLPSGFLLFQDNSDVAEFINSLAFIVDDKMNRFESWINYHQENTAITIISTVSDELYLMDIGVDDQYESNCSILAVTGAPTIHSKHLGDFSVGSVIRLPQQFPASYFTLILRDCYLKYIQISTECPDEYHKVKEGHSLYVYSPSYLDDERDSTFNVTFTSDNGKPLQYFVHIDHVEINGPDAELDISVLTNHTKQLSAVITGNQNGSRSKAIGESLNVEMHGRQCSGWAKLRFSVSSTTSTLRVFWMIWLFSLLHRIRMS